VTILLDIQDLYHTYTLADAHTLPALRGVSLRITAGEYVAIVGANGSGKSTLARHLNALLLPTQGQVLVAGRDTRKRAHLRDIRRTVGMVFQHPEDQLVATVVEEDVAFGPENLGLPPDEIAARVRAALETVGLWDARQRPPHLLSAGQMQRAALAGVLAMRPRCIVFDEATSMLDPAGRRTVLALLDQLHAEGMTIVTITHQMEEAARAERLIVLHAGQVVCDATPRQVFADPDALAAWGLGLPPAAALAHTLRSRLPALPASLLTHEELTDALIRCVPPHTLRCPPCPTSAPPEAPYFVEVHALGHDYMQGTPLEHRALHALDLRVLEGDSHGLLGATGSGKSTLMQHLNGLLRPQRGQVRVGPYDLNDPQVNVRAVRRLAGLVFQTPEQQIFEQYVGDEIAYGPRVQGFHGADLRERVRGAMETVGLDFDAFKDRYTFTLSGGERRKVALAATLALRPRLLLLDEPTAGLDPASRRELLQQLERLRASGVTLTLSSHQMEDLALLARRLTVLQNGTSVLDGETRALFAQGPQLRALGLGLPAVPKLVEALRARGWPLPAHILTAAELLACLPEPYHV